MRKAFYKKKKVFSYLRDEILAHEMCHAARSAFNEKKYEEILAYQTSLRPFTRYFGPILASQHLSKMIVFLLLAIFFIDVTFLLFDAFEAYLHALWLKVGLLFLVFIGCLSLIKKQTTFKKAKKNLSEITAYPLSVLFRLTDQEIDYCAKSSKEEIYQYLQGSQELRIQVIWASYFIRHLA